MSNHNFTLESKIKFQVSSADFELDTANLMLRHKELIFHLLGNITFFREIELCILGTLFDEIKSLNYLQIAIIFGLQAFNQ